MKILIACEESQTVTKEFRDRGHEAYSCDILPPSGGHPEWHLQQDVVPLLDEEWDMVIAFPPCTHLSVSGARHFEEKRGDGRQQQGIDFFMRFANCTAKRVAVENPVGIMSNVWRKPDQIIQPYYFGHTSRKTTCLWLKNLPFLKPTRLVEPDIIIVGGKTYSADYLQGVKRNKPGEASMKRSKTYLGIAQAMAEQWGDPKPLVEDCGSLFEEEM